MKKLTTQVQEKTLVLGALYFILYLSLAESPAFCMVVFVAISAVALQTIQEKNLSKGLFLLVALFPPVFLSLLNFPLVGRNLAPSLPLFAVMTGWLIIKVARRLSFNQPGWTAAGFVLALMGLSLFHLPEAYRIQAPMIQARTDVGSRPLLLIGKDGLYREAILYQVSETISVVPSAESILKDPKSKKFLLLARPEEVKSLSCDPWKTYRAYDKTRFRPIRYEDWIEEPKVGTQYQNVFSIYDLSICLSSRETATFKEKESITTIGRNYALAKTGMISPAKMHFTTGNRYLNAGYLREAVYEFNKALHFNPNMTQAHNNLALALIREQSFDEAQTHLKEANLLAPGMLETQNLFGLSHSLQGEWDRAIAYFETAIRINANHPTAYQQLLHIFSRSKNDPEKVRNYSKKLQQLTREKKP